MSKKHDRERHKVPDEVPEDFGPPEVPPPDEPLPEEPLPEEPVPDVEPGMPPADEPGPAGPPVTPPPVVAPPQPATRGGHANPAHHTEHELARALKNHTELLGLAHNINFNALAPILIHLIQVIVAGLRQPPPP